MPVFRTITQFRKTFLLADIREKNKMSTNKNLTKEVSLSGTTSYLIRINGKETCFVGTKHEAKLAVDSLAVKEEKDIKALDSRITTFRREVEKGKKVVIFTQKMGLFFNGSMIKTTEIDFVAVDHAQVIRGRHELSGNDSES